MAVPLWTLSAAFDIYAHKRQLKRGLRRSRDLLGDLEVFRHPACELRCDRGADKEARYSKDCLNGSRQFHPFIYLFSPSKSPLFFFRSFSQPISHCKKKKKKRQIQSRSPESSRQGDAHTEGKVLSRGDLYFSTCRPRSRKTFVCWPVDEELRFLCHCHPSPGIIPQTTWFWGLKRKIWTEPASHAGRSPSLRRPSSLH